MMCDWEAALSAAEAKYPLLCRKMAFALGSGGTPVRIPAAQLKFIGFWGQGRQAAAIYETRQSPQRAAK
jgi:hypothetical protein